MLEYDADNLSVQRILNDLYDISKSVKATEKVFGYEIIVLWQTLLQNKKFSGFCYVNRRCTSKTNDNSTLNYFTV